MIKAILFDYDGTLSNRQLSGYHMYRHIISLIFPEMDTNSIEFETIVQDCVNWDEFGTISKEHIYSHLNKKYNANADPVYWRDYWFAHFHEFQTLNDSCLSVLDELKKKYKLGVITNGNSYPQNQKLTLTGIRSYFDTIIVSGDVDVSKPDKKIFMMAVEQMGLKPEEVAFIGDTYSTDIIGAYNAGLMPVWIWPDFQRVAEFPIKRIHHFEELLEVFK